MTLKLKLFISLALIVFAYHAASLPSRAGVCMALLDLPAHGKDLSVARSEGLATSFTPRALDWAVMNARLRESSREIKLRIYTGSGQLADEPSLGMFLRAVHTQNFVAREIRGETAIRETIAHLSARADELAPPKNATRLWDHLSRSSKTALGTLPALITLGLLGSRYFSIAPAFDLAVEGVFGSLLALSVGGSYLHFRDHQGFTEIEAIEHLLADPKPNQVMFSVLRVPKIAAFRSDQSAADVVGQILRRNAGSHVLEHFGEILGDLLRRPPDNVFYYWQLFYFDAQTQEPVWWLGIPKI